MPQSLDSSQPCLFMPCLTLAAHSTLLMFQFSKIAIHHRYTLIHNVCPDSPTFQNDALPLHDVFRTCPAPSPHLFLFILCRDSTSARSVIVGTYSTCRTSRPVHRSGRICRQNTAWW